MKADQFNKAANSPKSGQTKPDIGRHSPKEGKAEKFRSVMARKIGAVKNLESLRKVKTKDRM